MRGNAQKTPNSSATALRRPNAPNTAERAGNIVIGTMNHAGGFLEWAGLTGKGIYADGELLLGRHPEYFANQAEAMAAVEFVLAAPEKAQDVSGNLAFVRKDEESGKIFRIEIQKEARGKRNHVRSAHEITEAQYEKGKVEGFPVLQPSPTEFQRGTAARSYSDLVREYNSKYPNVKPDSEENPNNVRLSVENVWTGGAADYDKPSLQFVNTGEGSQVYGWGLYGSSVRGVGEFYANYVVDHKNIPIEKKTLKYKGEKVGDNMESPEKIQAEDNLQRGVFHSILHSSYDSVEALRKRYESILSRFSGQSDESIPPPYRQMRKELAWLNENGKDLELSVEPANSRHLYRQTFWKGKKERLLDWDRPVTQKEINQIYDALAKETSNPAVIDFVNENRVHEQESYKPEELRKHLKEILGFRKGVQTGGEVHGELERIFGTPKDVRDFLVSAGFDGTTYIGDGSGVRNYVAFRDEDVEIEEHIRFDLDQDARHDVMWSAEHYSEQEKDDIVSALQKHVGLVMQEEMETYQARLKKDGINVPLDDMLGFAQEALYRNQKLHEEHRKQVAYAAFARENPQFAPIMPRLARGDMIIPSAKYASEDFSKGDFAHDAYRKFPKSKGEALSGKRRANWEARRKEAIESAEGMRSDELAKEIAERTGGDPEAIERDLIEFAKTVKRGDVLTAYNRGRKKRMSEDETVGREAGMRKKGEQSEKNF